MSTRIVNIGQLVTVDDELESGLLGILADAAVLLEGDRIVWVGSSRQAPDADTSIDADGACVLPGFVDSHSHLVFAGDRSAEFAARMAGDSYSAGGISSTVAATRSAGRSTLSASVQRLLDEALRSGTTTVEIKSGYGLNVATEARSLEVARAFTPETTFLGAHVVPPEFRTDRAAYVDLVVGDMLATCRPLASWIDVFCEAGAFDVDEARAVLEAGIAAGLGARMHANQLTSSGAAQLGVELGAASVDHCTFLSSADVAALAGSPTVATLVPAAEFSTRQPYPDARRLLDAGVAVAIATDCNPGSSFTTSMPFCIAVSVREMRMTPDEAVRAATRGGAQALRRDDVGIIRVGARADLTMLRAPSSIHLAYRPGVDIVDRVWQSGVETRVWRTATDGR